MLVHIQVIRAFKKDNGLNFLGGNGLFKWSKIGSSLGSMRRYIAFGFILFFAGLVVGSTNSSLQGYLNNQLEALQQLSNTLQESSEYPTMSFIIFIFLNNAIKTLMVICLGFFFGLLPIFFLVVNGMLIGYLLHHVQMEQGAGYMLDTVVRGLLPHGILEIPAIIIAAACGMKAGVLVMKRIFSFNNQAAASGELKLFIRQIVPLSLFLIGVLLVASIIESTITPWLLSL